MFLIFPPDELDYASDLEPSQADEERPRFSDENCGTAMPADFIAASQKTSSSSPQTSLPPTEDSKVSLITDCEGSEIVMEQLNGMPQSEIAQDTSLQLSSEQSFDVLKVDSKARERLGTSQTEDDADRLTTAGNSGVRSSNMEGDRDDVDRVAVAEDLHARSSSELESLNFSLIVDDVSSTGACNSDKQSDESRRLCGGVYDSNDSAFEDDVDCQAHLGGGYSEVLGGSCEEIPVSFSPDLGTSPGKSNDKTSEVIGEHVDKTDHLNSGVSCDGGTISGEAPTFVGSSLVDEAGYFPLPYCSGTEDVSQHFIADSRCSEYCDVEPACTHLSAIDGTSDCDVRESVRTGSVACLSDFVSNGLPSIDTESDILRPVENCEESEDKISECNRNGDLDNKPGCNLDRYDEEGPFLAVETCDGGVLGFPDGREELNCKNVFQVPENSSVVSQSVILPEVLEREQPAMDWNLEFSGIKDEAFSERKQSPVSNHELHAMPLDTPVLTSPEVVYVTPVLDGVNLEKSETDSNGPVCVSASAVNGASVRSKVSALLAKYSHHLELEKCPEDGDRMTLGMSHDVSSMRSLGIGVGHDAEMESKPGFYPRLASSPVFNHEFVASDFDNSFEGLPNGRFERLSTSAYAINIPDIAGLSDKILQAKDFDRRTDDAVADMNSDFSEEEEFGSNSPWGSDNYVGRVPAEDDSDDDMEWDGIELCKTLQEAPHRDRSVEISGEFARQTNDLSALRSMLSSCLSDSSSFRSTSGSPPRSLSPTEGCETYTLLEDSRSVQRSRVPKRGYSGTSTARSGVKEDDVLSVISEHTEPESDGDDS